MMMRSNDLLLGFDAREMWLDPQEYWPDSRKKLYLLRYDVVRPLSTDTLVWRDVLMRIHLSKDHSGPVRSNSCGTT